MVIYVHERTPYIENRDVTKMAGKKRAFPNHSNIGKVST